MIEIIKGILAESIVINHFAGNPSIPIIHNLISPYDAFGSKGGVARESIASIAGAVQCTLT